MAQVKSVTNEKKTSYLSLLGEHQFIKILLAKIISRFGDSLDIVAYGWLVFQLTGSSALLATIYAVSGIPSFLFNMVSGVWVTYLQKRTVVIVSDLGRGVIVLITAFLFLSGQLETWHLFVFAFLSSTFEAFRAPAATPLFMQTISEKNRNHAIAAMSSGSTFAEIIGYSVAGILIGTIGVGFVIMIDAVTFLGSALLIIAVKVKKEEISRAKLTITSYFSDLKEGLSYVVKSKLILSICAFAGFFNFFVIPFNALQPAYVDQILKKGPEAISIMSISFLIAMLIGGMISPKMKEKTSGRLMFLTGGFLIALGYYSLAMLDKINTTEFLYPGLICASVIMGFAITLINLPLKMAIMAHVERAYLPRTVSFINALSLSTTPIGGAFVGFLVMTINLKYVFMMFSIFILILYIVQLFNKSLKDI